MDMEKRNSELLSKAISYHQSGNAAQAEAHCLDILRSDARHYAALTLLGASRLHRGDLEEGVRLIERSLEINPRQPDALYFLGIALHEMNRHSEALVSYDRAIALMPGFFQAHNNRGLVLEVIGRHAEALDSYDRAIALNPMHANAHSNRGNVLSALGRYDAALGSYDHAIAINPGNAKAYYNRGVALSNLKRDEEALASYDRAVAIYPAYAKAYNNRGLALTALRRYDEALISYNKSIALNPDVAETHNNLGNALKDMKRYDDALASYGRAVELKPDDADIYLNMSYLKILLGEFEEGWALHEWRWRHRDSSRSPRRFPVPLWLGQESLRGKTVLLHTEQGFGDTIQFCRYAPMVEALGAKVVLQAPQMLVELLSSLKGSVHVIPMEHPLPDLDFHCPLMSLPLAFKTVSATIPADIPYLTADEDKRNDWRGRMETRAKPSVGLVWSGNPDHANDHNRSIPLNSLAPLHGLNIEYFCLQKDIRPADREFLVEQKWIRQYENGLSAFSDTAALLMEMDLVISVDTSVAHLAGALGKPVWIMLPFSPDYRWMAEGEGSPWYPTARLFRQPRAGDWSSVIAEVVAELGLLIKQ